MNEIFITLSQPVALWGLFATSVVLVLLDYLLPVDWLAYLGYLCFSVFVGVTIATTPMLSLVLVPVVALAMWIMHKFVFARFLTNVPRIECGGADQAALVPDSNTARENVNVS